MPGAITPLFVPELLAAISAARSQADYYRISLQVFRYATPLEVTAIAGSSAIPDGVFKVWLTKLRDVVMQQNPIVTKYRQRPLSNGVTLYSGGDPEGKVLLIGMCGHANNLCAPTSLVLQYLSDNRYDLLVLRDTQKLGFTLGIAGYAQPLPAVAERLRADLHVGRYREIRTFGVSSGGAAALLVGSLMEATHSVCISGKLPTHSGVYGTAPGASQLENALRKNAMGPTRASAVYAAANRVDGASARRLAHALNLRLISIPDVKDHAFLESLDRAGRLAGFFRTVGLLD